MKFNPTTPTRIAECVAVTAEVIHAANKAWCEALGDQSQADWKDTPQRLQDSVIQGVEHLLANPLHNPIDSHANWLAYKEADGWTYGEVKDAEALTHPCMVSYEDLDPDQKMKDSIFHSIVWGMWSRETFY